MRRVPVNRVGRRSGALHDRDDPRRPLRRRPNGARPPLGRTSRPSGLRPTTGSNPSSDDVVLRREHGTSPQGHGEGWAPPTSRDGSRSAPLGSRGRLEPPGFRGRRRRVLGRPHGRPPRCQRLPNIDPLSTPSPTQSPCRPAASARLICRRATDTWADQAAGREPLQLMWARVRHRGPIGAMTRCEVRGGEGTFAFATIHEPAGTGPSQRAGP